MADFELDERHAIKNENFQYSRWRTAAILKIVISPYLSEQELSYRKQIAHQPAHTIRRGHLRDIEIWVEGHSRSLETEPLDRSYTTHS